jgi:ABC-type uncharacterized transport system substrate-binding protein
MERRQVITLIGGAAAAPLILRPLPLRAQQPAVPVIGFLRSTSLADSTQLVTAFRRGLNESGYIEGQTVAIEFRWAEGHNDRLPALAAELVRRQVAVIVANSVSALAAKAATTTVPIVFTTGSDPVRDGLVGSLNRPGGNVTGVTFISGLLGAKRLELLRQLVPKATIIGMLVFPNTPETEAERRDVQSAAKASGLGLVIVDVGSDRDIETAFAEFVQRGVGALLTGNGPFLVSKRELVVALAARNAIPAMHAQREEVEAGGLMSYGPGNTDAYRQAGIYAGQILKGKKPANLPVMQSTTFDFVINLKTAKSLGLVVPDRLLVAATEVIE